MNNLDIYTLIFSTPIRQQDVQNHFFHSNKSNGHHISTSLMEKIKEKETKVYFNIESNQKIQIQS